MFLLQPFHSKKVFLQKNKHRICDGCNYSRMTIFSLLNPVLIVLLICTLSACTSVQNTGPETETSSLPQASDISDTVPTDTGISDSSASTEDTAFPSDQGSSETPTKKPDSPYTYLILNAPSVTVDGVTSYDFSAVAWKYMSEIASRFQNRNVAFGSRPGGFPEELAAIRRHDEAARYIFEELTAHGYQDISSIDSEADSASAIASDNPTDINCNCNFNSNNTTEQSNPISASDVLTESNRNSCTDAPSSKDDMTNISTETTATVRTLPELMNATLPLKNVCNITARLKGKDSSKQIIVGAHYDGDGAGDNASGTALLLAAACGLKEQGITPPVDLVFIFFDAEEIGFYGSKEYVEKMTDEEIASTLYMINMDSIAFGDYCNLFGGRFDTDGYTVTGLGAYQNAIAVADKFDINTCLIDELDGYFAANGTGPALDDTTIFTNPWTDENPPPKNYQYPSPMTGPWSDHEAFSQEGIDIIYFEASNMYSAGDGRYDCYSGYYETYDNSIGYYGMFMNTEYDTLENLETYFPGRARRHLSLFSRLLTALLQSG